MAQDRVTYARVLSNGAGGITADIEGAVYGPGVASMNPDLQAGDQVPVGFLHPQSSRQPLIIARRSTVAEFPALRSGVPPFSWGLWPQSRGGPGLSMVSQESQIKPDLAGGSFFIFNLSPINSTFPPLGLCCPQIDGNLRVAIYWPKLDGSNLQLVLTLANPVTGEIIWEAPIGTAFAPPTGNEVLTGLRMGWMSFDQQYQRFWLVGWGSSDRRKKVYCVSSNGVLLGSLATGSHLVQSSVGAGIFVKGWHSSRPLTTRQAPDDPLIRGYYRNNLGAVVPKWTLDPQTILPLFQLATSSAGNPFASTSNPEGAWPIDAERRQILIWVSASKKPNSSKETLLTYGSFVEPDDGRTMEHKASLVALNIDTGQVKWRRDWNYTATHSIDADSVAAEEAFRSVTIGGSTTLAERSHYPTNLSPWVSTKIYRGIAAEGSLSLHPIEGVTLPGCVDASGAPVYSEVPTPVLPLVGPNWGGGGLYNSPSIYGSFTGPLYSWYSPGHPILCPLPFNIFDYDAGPAFGWPLDGTLSPDDPSIARLDPVGGVLHIDSAGNAFAVHAHQGPAIVGGANDCQAQWMGHTEDFQEAADPVTQCGQWINALLHWDYYMIGAVKHNIILRLHRTGPNGEPLGDVDISQYYNLPDSDKTWAARANVWQIVVFVARGRVLVLRDKFETDIDSGDLENRPYLAVEVRDRDNLGTVLDTIPLVAGWADTFTDSSDPENPVLRRVWDQYSNQDTASLGKGSVHEEDGWVLWRHLIYNREESALYCNECLLEATNSGVTATRRLTSLGEFNRPESPSSVGTMALAGAKQIWAPEVNLSGAWPVMVRGNS